MPYIGNADFDRPITFESGPLYFSYGGGPFRLAPLQCGVPTVNGQVALQLDIVRALDERDSRASLSCSIAAEYASEDALRRVRELNADAAVATCPLTDWWFRVLPSAVLGAPVELTAPAMLASNGLGAARLMTWLPLETGIVLESMLHQTVELKGVAEAALVGVSPRLPLVVRFESGAVLAGVLQAADASGALPRRAIVDYFAQATSTLPLDVDGRLDETMMARFSEAMTDRFITRFGRYVPSQAMDDAPVVQFTAGSNSTVTWALSQPVLATRRIVMPVDLLTAAQAEIRRLGSASVVRRSTTTSLPSFGQTRVTALCNVPVSRAGVDALGVTLTFPPCPPARPQARTVTAVFDTPDDTAALDVLLSPSEPLRYRYSPFAVLTDDQGTRQVDAPARDGAGSPLHLSTEQFPIEFAVIEATPALGSLAIVSGSCTYGKDGVLHEQRFTLDSGCLTTAIAIPRNRDTLTIDGVAVARAGAQQLRIGPIESPQVRLDVTSFPAYGPQQVVVTCVFDDSATVQAVSVLPMDRAETPDNITALSLTPAEPSRVFRWSSQSPFAGGVRYRPFGVERGGWMEAPAGSTIVVTSSQCRARERQRVRRLESAPAGPAAPESAVDPVGLSPSYAPTDELLYTRIADAAKKLFVPRYALDLQSVSGQDRYRMTMSHRNGASTLEVNLSSGPAASIAEQALDAEAYPHRVVVLLDFLVAASAGARKSLEFTEVTRTDGFVKASLTFATLAERDDVYRAMTEPARDARLVVQRHLDVRVPERPATGGGGTFGGSGGGGPHLPGGPFLMSLPPRVLTTVRPRLPIPTPPPVAPTVLSPGGLSAAVVAAATPSTTFMLASPALARVGTFTRVESAFAGREAGSLLLRTRISSDLVLRPVGRFVASLPTPELSFTGMQDEGGSTRVTLSVGNWADYSDDFFAAGPASPNVAIRIARSMSRTAVDVIDADTNTRVYGFAFVASARQLSELSFPLAVGTVPARLSVTMTDRTTKVARTSNAVATAAPQPRVEATRDLRAQLDQTVTPSPFAFPPALYGYIFQDTTPTTGNNQLTRYRVAWKGTFYTYLQDASRPHVVYVFPDQFKIARRPDPPFTPFATVRVSSRPDASDTDVVFDYVVAPYTSPKRLADAGTQLLADPRFGATAVEFQPFLTSDVRFFIDRPAMSGAVRQERPDASVVLQGWLKDTLVMPIGDFRLLFDAMHRRTASLFIGRVEIDVPNDATETVPFTARMDDLAGEVFSYVIAPGAPGQLQVTARNEVESPLVIQAIDATVTANGQSVRGLVTGGGLPVASLAPGGTIQFTVAPERALGGTAQPDVTFDLGGVTSLPNPEAVWDSILDRTTVEYFRIITVKAIKGWFDPVAGRETEQIVSILLEFEGGGTGELTADTLETKVRVDNPIDDVMLGRPVSTAYHYTVTVIRANGRQDRDAAARESSSATFFVSVSP